MSLRESHISSKKPTELVFRDAGQAIAFHPTYMLRQNVPAENNIRRPGPRMFVPPSDYHIGPKWCFFFSADMFDHGGVFSADMIGGQWWSRAIRPRMR